MAHSLLILWTQASIKTMLMTLIQNLQKTYLVLKVLLSQKKNLDIAKKRSLK